MLKAMKREILIAVMFAFTIVASGQRLFETATQATSGNDEQGFMLNGYVRGSAFGGGEVFDYTTIFGEVSLQAELKKATFVMNSDIRFRRGFNFNQTISEVEIKEAYAGISTSVLDLFLGEQIILWGRTDGFNPTNNITPNNYFHFTANPDDQKIPNFMLKANIRFTPQIDWEVIAIPIFRPSRYRYDLFDMGANVSFTDAVLPGRVFRNSSLATKMNVEIRGIGFSASWFRGFDPFYGFDIKSVDFSGGTPVIAYIPSFYLKNTFGLDVALSVGTSIVRGEGALNLTENDDHKMYIPNDNVGYVAAIEHYVGGVLVIAQYVGTFTLRFAGLEIPVLSDPLNMQAQMQYANELISFESATYNRKIFHQQEKINHAISVIITKDFAYETVNAELSGYYDLTSEEYLVRPRLSFKIGSALTATAGYLFMKGPDKSVYGYASPIMNGVFVELKAIF
jgi:hypothetical protein